MTNIDRRIGQNVAVEPSSGSPTHMVVVVFGLPPSEMIVGGDVIKLSNQAGMGMELTGATAAVLTQKGFRKEVFATSRMLLQRPDPNVVEVHYEDERVFVSSREIIDPQTGRGSGRFVTTILTTEERIEGLDLLQNNQDQPQTLQKAA